LSHGQRLALGVRNKKPNVCSFVNSKVVPVHTTKVYSRSSSIVPLILLTLVLNGSEWLLLHLGCCTPGNCPSTFE
jgi:hypothetical protein